MLTRVFGAGVDARVVAAARGIVIAVILAAAVAAQKALADPSLESYGWVPVAALVLRLVEGIFDHSDSTRSG